METYSDWLARTERIEERKSFLEESLFDGKLVPYLAFRLQFFFFRFCADSLLHLVEFLFLAAIFSSTALYIALTLRCFTLLVNGAWWGALEVMREEVRRLISEGRADKVKSRVTLWVNFGLLLAAASLIASVTWTVHGILAGEALMLQVYGFSLLLGVSLQFFVRTLHSGVYAVRRVYRPLAVLIGLEAGGLIGTLLFWPLCGPWSFVISSLIMVVVSNVVTFIYVNRMYTFVSYLGYRIDLSRRNLRRLARVPWDKFCLCGLAGGMMRIENILLLVAFGLWDSHELVVSLYILRPFLFGAVEWGRLFYFDFKRAELGKFRLYREQLMAALVKLSFIMGALTWTLGALTIYFFRVTEREILIGLAPLFLAGSLLSFYQVRAFAERRYWIVIVSNAFLLIGAFVLIGPEMELVPRTLTLAMLLVGVAVVQGLKIFRSSARVEWEVWLGVGDWMSMLESLQTPVTVGRLRLAESCGAVDLRTVRIELQKQLGVHGKICSPHKRELLWFFDPVKSGFMKRDLVECSGGTIENIWLFCRCADGAEALSQALNSGWLGRMSRRRFPAHRVDLERTLTKRFKTICPAGVVLTPNTKLPSGDFAERRQVILEGFRYLEKLSAYASTKHHIVSALAIGGKLKVIYLLPRSAETKLVRTWRRTVRDANLRMIMTAQS